MAEKKFTRPAGFGLTMGFTVFYLSAIALISDRRSVSENAGDFPTDFWRLATTDARWPHTN